MAINILDAAVAAKLAYKISASTHYMPASKAEIQLFKKVDRFVVFSESEDYDAQCIFLSSTDHETMIVAVRGSDSVVDWVENIKVRNTQGGCAAHEEHKDLGIKFHRGFYQQWHSISEKMIEIVARFAADGGKKILFTGHSAGGPQCSIAAFQMLIDGHWTGETTVTTFGAPKFTNTAGTMWFAENTQYTRVLNYYDPVPNIPIFRGNKQYRHVDIFVVLFKNGGLVSDVTAPSQYGDVPCIIYLARWLRCRINVAEHSMGKYVSLIKTNNVLYKLPR